MLSRTRPAIARSISTIRRRPPGRWALVGGWNREAAVTYDWDRVDTIRADLEGKCPDHLDDEQHSAVDKLLVEATDALSGVTTSESAAEIGDTLHVLTLRTLYPDCPWSAVDPTSFSGDDLELLHQIFDPSELGQ